MRIYSWVANITLDRLNKYYNACTGTELPDMCESIHDILVNNKIDVGIIDGVGEKAFCTGVDGRTYCTIYLGNPSKPLQHPSTRWRKDRNAGGHGTGKT
jgi:1,4-dihydroxy-2-naphthoyl-CoA synthase